MSTGYGELDDVLATFRTAVRAELADNFVGLYLQGSFAAGGFDEYSDCDWIVVTEGEPTGDLQGMHERIYDLPSRWAQHLEGSYFPRAALRAYVPDAPPVLYLDNGSRVLERSNHCDTLVVRWTLREHGVVLAGPEPKTLVDPVDPDALCDEVRGVMDSWSTSILTKPEQMREQWHQAFVVVAYCRFLHTLETGRVTSKPAATAWARKRFDPRWHALLDRAEARRGIVYADPHAPENPAVLAETVEYVRYCLELPLPD